MEKHFHHSRRPSHRALFEGGRAAGKPSPVPVANSHVQAQDVSSYHGDNPHLHVNDYPGNVTDLGFSGPGGKLLVPGALWADLPFFAVAFGKALTVGRFPSMKSCDTGPDCPFTLVMPPPNAFPGLLLRPSPSGQASWFGIRRPEAG